MSFLAKLNDQLDPEYSVFVDRPEPGNAGGPGATQPNVVSEGSSSCYYPGKNLEHDVNLTIYQSPFSDQGTIAETVRYGTETGKKQTRNGFDIYTGEHSDKPVWEVIFTNQQLAARLTVDIGPGSFGRQDTQTVVSAFTDTILAALTAPPGPAAEIKYTDRYAGIDPCQLFSGQDFQHFVGSPDDGHPHAEYQYGERILDADPAKKLPTAHYIDAQCQRMTPALDHGQSGGIGLVAEFKVYQTVDQARNGISATCDPNTSGQPYGPPIPESVKIGDDLVCYPQLNGSDWLLTFRSGRTEASLWLWESIDRSRLGAITAALAPLAQALAAKLAAL